MLPHTSVGFQAARCWGLRTDENQRTDERVPLEAVKREPLAVHDYRYPCPCSDYFFQSGGRRVPGVGRVGRFNQQEVDLFFGQGTMLNSPRDDIQISRSEMDVAAAKLDRQMAFQYKEEVVRVWVGVPHEFPLNFDHHYVIPVKAGNDPGRPVLGKLPQLVFEIDDVCHSITSSHPSYQTFRMSDV